MPNISEISLQDIIYKIKDDNAVTREELEEALGNVGNTSVVIQAEAPTDTSVIWIDTDDEGGEVLAAVATSGNYNDLINKPTIITSYNSLTDKPTIITIEQVKAEINTAIAAIAIYDGSVS